MIPGTVPVAGPFAPTAETDSYATHDAKYGKDGWRNVANAAERDTIPELRRNAGMVVGVQDEGRWYALKPEPWVYDETDWDEIVFNASTDIYYTNTTPVPETLGGILQGSTFDHVNITGVLDTLLYPQLNPAFTMFRVDGMTSMQFEVGDVFAAGDHLFTWTTSNPAYVIADTISIYNHTGGTTLATGLPNDGTETVNVPSAITKTSRAAHYFRIAGENSKHLLFARYFSMEWLWHRYVGDSADPMLDEAGLQALLVDNGLSKLMTGTFSFTSPGYKYFAFPADSGWINPYNGNFYVKQVESIRDYATNLNIAMADDTDGYTNVTNGINHRTVTLTNVFGYNRTYYVYRTKHVINGSVTIVTG